MKPKHEIILQAEEALARYVSLGVIVTRPLSVWHYLIPFMFVLDFLKRTTTTRRYTELFMFPRKLAMDSALAHKEETDKDGLPLGWQSAVTEWLSSLGLLSQDVFDTQIEVIRLLKKHYERLLQAEGQTYDDLIRNAYGSRYNYQLFLRELTMAEKEVDKAILKMGGGESKLKEKLIAEQEQLKRFRDKELERIF